MYVHVLYKRVCLQTYFSFDCVRLSFSFCRVNVPCSCCDCAVSENPFLVACDLDAADIKKNLYCF